MTQEEFAEEYPLDLGSGVRGDWYSYNGVSHAGLVVAHLHTDGKLCAGAVGIKGRDFIGYDGQRPLWDMSSEEPLTLTPSIDNSQEEGCNLHGFITNGVWVGPA